eukprot:TRINITY_DN7312_c0_g1_i1.p1 TRINITY_DN7312_c0_g1~~TRINITY_DN7312_c0_g1_i1.p1  ORF type:complete len:191 (+),score=41.77 TRINITY_DN7312_c0_g1_i1:2-574(+)
MILKSGNTFKEFLIGGFERRDILNFLFGYRNYISCEALLNEIKSVLNEREDNEIKKRILYLFENWSEYLPQEYESLNLKEFHIFFPKLPLIFNHQNKVNSDNSLDKSTNKPYIKTKILKFNTVKVSQQLTRIIGEDFYQIKAFELLIKKRDDIEENLKSMIKRFDQIAFWVRNIIFQKKKKKIKMKIKLN